MAIIQSLNTQTLVHPGTIFGAKIQTPEVKMDIAQAVHFIIQSGLGTTATVTAQIYAKVEGKDTAPILIREEQITIGGNTTSTIVVRARELCHDEKNCAYLVIPNASAPAIVGSVLAVLTNERWNRG